MFHFFDKILTIGNKTMKDIKDAVYFNATPKEGRAVGVLANGLIVRYDNPYDAIAAMNDDLLKNAAIIGYQKSIMKNHLSSCLSIEINDDIQRDKMVRVGLPYLLGGTQEEKPQVVTSPKVSTSSSPFFSSADKVLEADELEDPTHNESQSSFSYMQNNNRG